MKKVLAVFALFAMLFSGCGNKNSGMERALALRQKIQQNTCSFHADITADYGDTVHEFGMDCQADSSGNLSFTVTAPETIQGITGTVDGTGGNLTFDKAVLAFELLADGQITPVSAPWILIRTLRGGYIHATADTENGTKLIINDSYEEDSLQLDIWLDEEDYPVAAEILWQGKRIVSLTVKNFSI